MRYLVSALLALAFLIGLPLAVDPPETMLWQVLALALGLVLVYIAFRGFYGFAESRRRAYHDSILPPPEKGAPKQDHLP